MDECKGETWRFTARPGSAEQVYLVIDGPTTPSRWIEMKPAEGEPGAWRIQADVAPGRTRVRYFTANRGTYLNCGNVGLHGERLSEADPAVKLEDTDLAASA